jgi:hypothetical protein
LVHGITVRCHKIFYLILRSPRSGRLEGRTMLMQRRHPNLFAFGNPRDRGYLIHASVNLFSRNEYSIALVIRKDTASR